MRRNKSKNYSIKLNKLFIETLKQVAESPTIGRKTEFENVRVRIVRDYLLFYRYDQKQVKVLTVWDGNREEKTLEIT
ncbi:MAG: type II toxin-antitoxin system RelE/ParE family toxin [Bacteroidetes bacterium]|nr:type II toxin-antitoxin system RelE/ParE family toxin [Bacteroidota bacterium]